MAVNVQISVSDDVAKIATAVRNAEKVFNDGDLDALVKLNAEDCRFITPGLPHLQGREGQPNHQLSYCIYSYPARNIASYMYQLDLF